MCLGDTDAPADERLKQPQEYRHVPFTAGEPPAALADWIGRNQYPIRAGLDMCLTGKGPSIFGNRFHQQALRDGSGQRLQKSLRRSWDPGIRYPFRRPESNHLLTVRGATLQILATCPVVKTFIAGSPLRSR